MVQATISDPRACSGIVRRPHTARFSSAVRGKQRQEGGSQEAPASGVDGHGELAFHTPPAEAEADRQHVQQSSGRL